MVRLWYTTNQKYFSLGSSNMEIQLVLGLLIIKILKLKEFGLLKMGLFRIHQVNNKH